MPEVSTRRSRVISAPPDTPKARPGIRDPGENLPTGLSARVRQPRRPIPRSATRFRFRSTSERTTAPPVLHQQSLHPYPFKYLSCEKRDGDLVSAAPRRKTTASSASTPYRSHG